ncbi:OmpA family protein [Halofilum ochraceum]|uniref:OmpA family protein n=1 Tax=Halofilum ochraceum TaxID=1611323 RepID=UPI0008D907C2|nr:OmpA family protein [Halofilum ochraceum]
MLRAIRTIRFSPPAAVILALIAGMITLPAFAADPDTRGYVTTRDGDVWMTRYGECWRSPYPAEEDQSEFAEKCGDVVDSDGDGVNDPDDQCPDTPEGVRVDDNGCALDSDGDGVTDVNDQCPGTPSGARVDANGCALDSDGDGVADHADSCPGTASGRPVDNSGCVLDSDGDGVADDRDQCPGTPEGAEVRDSGCEVIDLEVEGGEFAVNSAELRPETERALQDTAASLKARGGVDRIEIIGYTDSQGSADYNRDLSRRRAEAVADYLADQGIDRDLMSVSGRGEADPVATNATAEGRARNRRVIILPR